MSGKRVRMPDLVEMKRSGRKIVMVTAYDYTMAGLVEAAGVDVVLVGDSVGNVMAGYDSTLPVTMDQMVYHASLVARACRRALVVADMPFMSYEVSPEQALQNAGRLMKEAGVAAVKLEGGREYAETVRRLVAAGIPVVGHLGLPPQSVHTIGGYRVQGKTKEEADRILEDALALEEAGAGAIVLELVPAEVGKRISEALTVPTIGIGAGPHCDGQVLVINDLLGMSGDFRPRFVKRYAELGEAILRAVETYAEEVRSGQFPGEEHSF